MTYDTIYNQLLKYCEENGVIVKHISMSNQWMGEFDCETNIIRINKNIRSPKTKCKTLAHEVGHYLDYKFGTHKEFFTHLGKYSSRKMRLVINAEQSASMHAVQIFQYYGKNVDFEEFDYYLIAFILAPIWRKIYFDH